jgi:hypothetical protein
MYYAVTGRNTRGDWYSALGETLPTRATTAASWNVSAGATARLCPLSPGVVEGDIVAADVQTLTEDGTTIIGGATWPASSG